MPEVLPLISLPFSRIAFKAILLEAGNRIRNWYHISPDIEIKLDGSPLTAADRDVDEFLKKGLNNLFPEAGWLSEETVDSPERLEKEWVWVVDPLDGTKEFTMHIPEVSVSIGLVYKQKVVFGAVYNPITGEGGLGSTDGNNEFWGFRDCSPNVQTLNEATAIVSRTESNRGQIDPYRVLFHDIKPVGSVAYKLLRVAAKRDTLTFSVQPKSEWDLCGGVALIQSMGMLFKRADSTGVKFNQSDVLITSHTAGGPQHLINELIPYLTK
ncbi:MAG: 3'(2'),5'-bisphosphate nucleotidase CysQ [Anaerolineaceae bacterium]|nr:3'(2'),5'-bisphosphate nucleotidase CysQ [Anaerolineaceae bacterium]